MKNEIWTIKRMLEWASDYFNQKGLESPRLLVEYTLSHILELPNRLDLYLQFDRPLSTVELDKLRPLIKRLAQGEPLQYVIGSQPFLGILIKTDQRALIPRPETEELVDIILQEYTHSDDEIRLIDVGTGTACIPLAIKNKLPKMNCLATDISEDALSLAFENAKALHLDLKIARFDFTSEPPYEWLHSFEIVTSNPPYIGHNEQTVDKHVHLWEPHLALYSKDVVACYQSVCKTAHTLLTPSGRLFLELNPIYAEEIASNASTLFSEVLLKKDLAEKTRFLLASAPIKAC